MDRIARLRQDRRWPIRIARYALQEAELWNFPIERLALNKAELEALDRVMTQRKVKRKPAKRRKKAAVKSKVTKLP